MESRPRFEFRSFGQNFDSSCRRMSRLSMPMPEEMWERISNEIYIVSENNTVNAKIRDGKMDMKEFIQSIDGFEQWNSVMKGEFPIEAEVLKNKIFPTFGVVIPELNKDNYSASEFLELVNEHPQLKAVHVHKRRFAYMVNNTICETGIILINGARVFTISSESTEIEDIKKTIKDTGLEGVENINYLQAIKRITGMISQPLAN